MSGCSVNNRTASGIAEVADLTTRGTTELGLGVETSAGFGTEPLSVEGAEGLHVRTIALGEVVTMGATGSHSMATESLVVVTSSNSRVVTPVATSKRKMGIATVSDDSIVTAGGGRIGIMKRADLPLRSTAGLGLGVITLLGLWTEPLVVETDLGVPTAVALQGIEALVSAARLADWAQDRAVVASAQGGVVTGGTTDSIHCVRTSVTEHAVSLLGIVTLGGAASHRRSRVAMSAVSVGETTTGSEKTRTTVGGVESANLVLDWTTGLSLGIEALASLWTEPLILATEGLGIGTVASGAGVVTSGATDSKAFATNDSHAGITIRGGRVVTLLGTTRQGVELVASGSDLGCRTAGVVLELQSGIQTDLGSGGTAVAGGLVVTLIGLGTIPLSARVAKLFVSTAVLKLGVVTTSSAKVLTCWAEDRFVLEA